MVSFSVLQGVAGLPGRGSLQTEIPPRLVSGVMFPSDSGLRELFPQLGPEGSTLKLIRVWLTPFVAGQPPQGGAAVSAEAAVSFVGIGSFVAADFSGRWE